MVSADAFGKAAKRAIQNIIKHGDTDIFPFSFESHAFFDKQDLLQELIMDYDKKAEEYLVLYPPSNVSSLVPVTYSGFRWATQIDPIWNAYFLSCVLALAPKIEAVRLAIEDNIVFSYRYNYDEESGNLFDKNVGWFQFMKYSLELSNSYRFVGSCDIAEFYSRLGHHKLENALQQIAGDTIYPKRVMAFLSNFSNTNSFGLPVGGPAARLLSELTINQVDRLLLSVGINFARFVDDYHIFANSQNDAYSSLIIISDKLYTTLTKA